MNERKSRFITLNAQSIVLILFAALVVSAGLVATGSLDGHLPEVRSAEAANPSGAMSRDTTANHGLPNVSRVFEEQKDKVVAITSKSAARGGPSLFFGSPFSGQPSQMPPQMGQGSGFIVDADGYILTNHHVVDGAQELTVVLKSGKSYQAEVVGSDIQTDIALLKVNADTKLPAVSLGRSDHVRVGEWVVAIGNPFGLDYTVTAGIISAKGRNIGHGPYDDFIQTDASINPGNSGGPLFNMEGEVIGVNTAIRRDGQGIGFAVPIDTVKRVVPQLRQNGYVSRGYLGAGIQGLDEDLAKTFGVQKDSGVLLGSVVQDGPAAQAGLKAGDIVTEFNGKPTPNTHELLLAVASTPPGEKAPVKFIRDGRQRSLNVAVAERPSEGEQQVLPTREAPQKSSVLGLEVAPVTQELAQRFKATAGKGVVVQRVSANSPLARVLRPGDIIEQVGSQSISSEAELKAALDQHDSTQPLRLLLRRDGQTTYLALRLG